jgi:hypothetical protein
VWLNYSGLRWPGHRRLCSSRPLATTATDHTRVLASRLRWAYLSCTHPHHRKPPALLHKAQAEMGSRPQRITRRRFSSALTAVAGLLLLLFCPVSEDAAAEHPRVAYTAPVLVASVTEGLGSTSSGLCGPPKVRCPFLLTSWSMARAASGYWMLSTHVSQSSTAKARHILDWQPEEPWRVAGGSRLEIDGMGRLHIVCRRSDGLARLDLVGLDGGAISSSLLLVPWLSDYRFWTTGPGDSYLCSRRGGDRNRGKPIIIG